MQSVNKAAPLHPISPVYIAILLLFTLTATNTPTILSLSVRAVSERERERETWSVDHVSVIIVQFETLINWSLQLIALIRKIITRSAGRVIGGSGRVSDNYTRAALLELFRRIHGIQFRIKIQLRIKIPSKLTNGIISWLDYEILVTFTTGICTIQITMNLPIL